MIDRDQMAMKFASVLLDNTLEASRNAMTQEDSSAYIKNQCRLIPAAAYALADAMAKEGAKQP